MQSSEPDPLPERQDIATGDGERDRLNSTERAQWLVLGAFLLTLGGAMVLTFFQHHHDLQTGVFVVLALASILGLHWHQNRQRYYQGLLARQQSERNLADEKLRKLGQAVEQSPESIVITDLAGNIEYSNLTFSKISGYSAAEALGQNPRLLQSGETPKSTYEEMWRTLLAGNNWQGEFRNRRKGGEVYVELAHISPITQPDGRITHYLAIKKDITAQKRDGEAIRESKLLLQSVIDSTPDWVYVKDPEHRLLLVNATFAAAFRQTPEGMIGCQDTDFLPSSVYRLESDQASTPLHDNDLSVFGGQAIQHVGEKLTFDDATVRVFDTFKGPLRDASRNIYGILCYRRDITERYNKELQQHALERQLLQSQKMELIGHLTGGIAHDFNNILASMLGFTEILQMSPDITKIPKASSYLEEILQAGVRGKELVAQLLTFSHRREAAAEAIPLAPIIREVIKLLRSTLPTTISMTTSIAEGLPEVLISSVQLHQILMNLSINARDAIADKGAIAIQAEAVVFDDFRVCSSCQNNFMGGYVTISVRDSGMGILPEHLPKIFDPFFTTKEMGHGSGLGLSVLHGIVHSANGHIEVRSVPGEETEFRIFLPSHYSETRREGHKFKMDDALIAVDGHVMVVDDEASIVGFMTALLENLGCRVTGLTSATEALRLFNENPEGIDLVITDQSMPDLTGAELAGALLARRPDLPIILATGYSNSIDEDTAKRIGIRRLLMKPVAAKVYADIVAEFLTEKA